MYNDKAFKKNDYSDYTIEELLFELPAEIATPELIRRGVKVIRSIRQTAVDIFNEVADEKYRELCMPVLTFDNCLRWMNKERMLYPDAGYLFIHIQATLLPRNDNDNYSVTVALLDKNKKPIPARNGNIQGQEIVCMVIPVGNVDSKLMSVLNGEDSVNIKL